MRWLSACSCLFLLAGAGAAQAQKAKDADPAAGLFGPDKLWTVHLNLSAEAWEKMQPKKGFGFGMKPPPPKQGKEGKQPGPGQAGPGKFGFDFQYASGTVEFDKETVKDVGIRFKGNSSYGMSGSGLKRPFKIDFNRYVEGQRFHGLTLLSLSNNAFDPSQLREALSYQVFREAGVPAPRTAFVRLYLTVDGKYEKQYLGLYTLIEAINKPFLKREFGTKEGMLLKPEGLRGLPYFGEDIANYKDRYQPRNEPTAKQGKRLIDFTKLVNSSNDATFRKEIGNYLEVDKFLRFFAANTLMSNMDSFFGTGHNYFLYLHPKTNKFTFMPWDLNMSFGGLTMMISGGNQAELSIKKPFLGGNRLAERLLAMPEHNQAYRKHLENLTKTTFTVAKLHAAIDALQKTIQPALAAEPKGGPKFGFGMMGGAQDLKPFIEKRVASVAAQLAGKSEGVVVNLSFGGPGFGGGGFGPGMFLVKDFLKAADDNKDGKVSPQELKALFRKVFRASDPDGKGLVGETALADALNKVFPPPQFGFGPKPPPKDAKGPKKGGFGLGLARGLIKLAGPDADGKVSEAKFLGAAAVFFKEADTNKSGFLEEKEIIDRLNRLFPPPIGGPGFGGPPGFPMPPANQPKKEEKKQ